MKTAFAANAPPPEQDVATQLNEQAQEADKAENEVAAEAAKSGGAPAEGAAQAAAPAQISMGQTIDEVTAILGKPKNIVDLGTKKIYVYNDMKITFKAGKVADVE